MAKKYVETNSSSNAAALYPEERVTKINLVTLLITQKIQWKQWYFTVLSQCTIIHSNRFRWTCKNSVKSPPLLRKVYFSKIWPSFHASDGKVTLKTSDRAVLKATWTFIWSEGKIFSAWLKFYFYFPLCGCFRDLIIVHFSRPLPKIKWHLLTPRKARDRDC